MNQKIDPSDVIHLNTVLVMGTLDEPLAELIVNGTAVQPTASQTVVRLLLPVLRVEGDEDSQTAKPVAAITPGDKVRNIQAHSPAKHEITHDKLLRPL